jgi:putative ABC transport system permease protein
MSAWRTWFYTLKGSDEPEQVWGVRASANFFQVLGVQTALGRAFLPEEERAGHDQVVVLSHGLWERRYGSDPTIIGQMINIDNIPFNVLGVLPSDFNLFGTSRQYDLWMPFALEREGLRRDDRSIIVFARIKADVSRDEAQAEMSSVAANLARENPATNAGLTALVTTMQEHQTERLRPALAVLLVSVSFILAIACVNIANLMLARAVRRQREIAIRLALGAGRVRLVRQFLTESLLLSIPAGMLGLLAALWSIDLLKAALPAGMNEVPRASQIRIDPTVLAFTFGASILTGIVFGLAPASRASKPNLVEALKEGGNSSISTHGRRSRDLLIVAEVSLAMALLAGTGLLIRSFFKIISIDPGFNIENVLTMQVWLPEARYTQGHQVAEFYRQSLERIERIPGVEAASAINFLPLTGWGDTVRFTIEGRPVPEPADEPVADYCVIDPNYFRAMEIPLLAGRHFDAGDAADKPPVVTISESLARRHWPGEDPIGKRIRLNFPASRAPWRPNAAESATSANSWATIAGIARNVTEELAGEPRPGQIYLPYSQNPSRLMRLVVRAGPSNAGLAGLVRQELLAVDGDQPVTEVKTIGQVFSEAVFQRRLHTVLLGLFATLALVLSAAGIYGVVSYSVDQRRSEMGLRMALGADSRKVFKLIVKQGMTPVLVGMAAGLGAAIVLARLLSNLLYGVSPIDPIALAVTSLLMVISALLACYLPARRAAKVDPMIALRHE